MEILQQVHGTWHIVRKGAYSTHSYTVVKVYAVVEEVYRYCTEVKVAILQCKNTCYKKSPASKSHSSKSTKVLASK